MKQTIRNYFVALLSIVVGSVVVNGESLAETELPPVTCIEGPPQSLAYGEHTDSCVIDPVGEADLFTFVGDVDDHVRINVMSTTTNMDPLLEVRDENGNLIDSRSCSQLGCTFSLDMALPASGTYLLTMSDAGNNESGAYLMQLEKLSPAPLLQRVDYDMAVSDAISPQTDIDYYHFNAAAGTSIRINARSTSTNMDPTIELRDPNGTLVMNGAADGASCSQLGCTFSVDFDPSLTGVYSLIMYDSLTNEPGNYMLSLWCIVGPCDSDGDGIPDDEAPVLSYDAPVSDAISPEVDADQFQFNVTEGTSIRINARSTSTNMDPTIEVRDSNGILVLNGAADGASCSQLGCTFSVDLDPVVTDTYSLIIYDLGTNEPGNYMLSLWCIDGLCDSDADAPPLLSYVIPVSDSIMPELDVDTYRFNTAAETLVRVSARSTSTNMDPTIEIRDPNGTLVLNGAADGASCNQLGCTFSVDFVPAFSGTYTMLVYDLATNEPGNYMLSLWCVLGDCDSDLDGFFDTHREVIAYGETKASYEISPELDADYFLFQGTAGDQVRLTGFSASTNMDPTIEVYAPDGTRVLNGAADGASCNQLGCSFSVDFFPAMTGIYSVVLYDRVTNEPGQYNFGLECIFSPVDFVCDDISDSIPPCDVCSLVDNPDQRDTNGDGYGNICDPDLDDNGVVQAADLAVLKELFFTRDPDADLDGNGFVQAGDLAIMKQMFFQPPGPSCVAP